ncbi:hypothetical protein NDU88_001782 [Pleurodeles waltl]|uniref:Uncharacterized protein n=1 Tax=Pleurodeles waltl TaxID=8319 RepID=A0AAV7M244_PLEWA|nr:hypothetical protein NDU88_001782 [Pleurodeles waltl]
MGTRAHTLLAQTVMVAARAQDETASKSRDLRTECCQGIPIQCSHRLRKPDDSVHAVRSTLPLQEWRSVRIFTLNAQAPEVAPTARRQVYVEIKEIKTHSVDTSVIMAPAEYIDVTDFSFVMAALCIVFAPLFWNVVSGKIQRA